MPELQGGAKELVGIYFSKENFRGGGYSLLQPQRPCLRKQELVLRGFSPLIFLAVKCDHAPPQTNLQPSRRTRTSLLFRRLHLQSKNYELRYGLLEAPQAQNFRAAGLGISGVVVGHGKCAAGAIFFGNAG